MTGRYMFMFAECYRCRKVFGSNPHLVPTTRDVISGNKEPLCADCVAAIQAFQRSLIAEGKTGITVWPDPMPGAYEPVDTYGDSTPDIGEDY